MSMNPTPFAEQLELRCVPEPNTGCWLWYGPTTPAGYGEAWFNYKRAAVHRVSWEVHRGPIPDGFVVCHKCDVPLCFNPSHLFLGTHADNNRDMRRKGRQAPQGGQNNASSRLTEAQVREIKSLLGRVSQRLLGLRYGVSRTCIAGIAQGRNWASI